MKGLLIPANPSLNCRQRIGVEACGECSSCKRISKSTFPPFGDAEDDKARLIWSEHADVAMARPYKQIIRVTPMRELEREANFRPFEGARRVFPQIGVGQPLDIDRKVIRPGVDILPRDHAPDAIILPLRSWRNRAGDFNRVR